MNETKLGHEVAGDGELIGCDPRQMTTAELADLGHKPMSPLKALRLHCIDCAGGSGAEVRKCVATACPAWPFRMGANPYRTKRTLTDEQRQKLAAARKSSLSARKNDQVGPEGTQAA